MMSQDHWLPLTEYAMRTGISISTIRRRIKSHTIAYKMEEGRYLIQADAFVEKAETKDTGFVSEEPVKAILQANLNPISAPSSDLHWKAMEARVSGLAKKVEFLSEQLAEVKMLVKVFEEKVDEIH
jgi:hypothetical protein